jgi:aspartate/methionine/tyrosine aminotransferase
VTGENVPKHKQQTNRLDKIVPSGIRKMFERAQGLEGVISLGIGAPDLPPPQGILDNVVECSKEVRSHSYTLNSGINDLRDKIVNQYQELYRLDFERQGVVVTTGGTQAMFTMIFAMTNPGDEIIVPDPGFVYYPTIPLLANLKVKPIPLDEEFQMSPDLVSEAVTDKTRMIITNSPSNPTGGMFTKETTKGIADIAIDNQLSIMSDEVYEFMTFDGNKHYPFAKFAPDNTVTLNTFSKTYCVPGWRLGYVIGEKELMAPINKFHPFIVANSPSLFQYAIAKFMGTPEDLAFRTEICKVMEKRAKVTEKEFTAIDGITVPKIKGSFYAYPRVDLFPEDENPGDKYVEHVFDKAKVVTVPGSEFGTHSNNHFRISFGSASEEKLIESANRIKEIKI